MEKIKCQKCLKNYKLIFMDISMPIMNGYEASLKIRNLEEYNQTNKSIIVGLTGHSTDNYKK